MVAALFFFGVAAAFLGVSSALAPAFFGVSSAALAFGFFGVSSALAFAFSGAAPADFFSAAFCIRRQGLGLRQALVSMGSPCCPWEASCQGWRVFEMGEG